MDALDNIRDIFSILHDGTISAWNGNNELLTLTVECEYLASRIDKSFDKFFVQLYYVDKLVLDSWGTSSNHTIIPKTDLADIFKAELEILYAETKDNAVVVDCNQRDSGFNFCGGNLIIRSRGIQILDQAENILTIDELKKICNAYWEELSKK